MKTPITADDIAAARAAIEAAAVAAGYLTDPLDHGAFAAVAREWGFSRSYIQAIWAGKRRLPLSQRKQLTTVAT